MIRSIDFNRRHRRIQPDAPPLSTARQRQRTHHRYREDADHNTAAAPGTDQSVRRCKQVHRLETRGGGRPLEVQSRVVVAYATSVLQFLRTIDTTLPPNSTFIWSWTATECAGRPSCAPRSRVTTASCTQLGKNARIGASCRAELVARCRQALRPLLAVLRRQWIS